jgi:hypothetical protein
VKRKRVYLKDGKANTKGEGQLIGFLNASGIVVPYQTFNVDKETTVIIPVTEEYANNIDQRFKKKLERNIIHDTDIN